MYCKASMYAFAFGQDAFYTPDNIFSTCDLRQQCKRSSNAQSALSTQQAATMLQWVFIRCNSSHKKCAKGSLGATVLGVRAGKKH